ncbi:TetR/AcrR family transcriptional regulator [Rhodobaculum claviforme]|nr:TetR/AcrR family transcriptional regulator [Rhodobaculum claviforme]
MELPLEPLTMDSPPTAPRKPAAKPRNPERTRAQILAVALREFARHGFHGARVERITKAARCNPRMLYHYFGSKEQLYLAALDEVYAGIRAQERSLDLESGPPEQAMQRLVEFTFDFFATNDVFLRMTRNENVLGGRHIQRSRMIRDMSQPLLDAIGRLVARGHAQGAFRERVDPLQLYVSIVALSAHHLNNAATLSATFGTDLTDPAWTRARRDHAVAMVLGYLGADGRGRRPDTEAGT